MTMQTVHEVLAMLQKVVAAPKDKRNDFGKYNYRTAEGMLAAVKPRLPEGAHITCQDEPAELCGKLVLKTTATLFYAGETVSATSFALHAFMKKGMDEAQISGAASSYARKYALGGLLAIDDGSQDPDGKEHKEPENHPVLSPDQVSEIQSLAEQARVSDDDVCKKAGVAHLAEIPKKMFKGLKKGLTNKANEREES